MPLPFRADSPTPGLADKLRSGPNCNPLLPFPRSPPASPGPLLPPAGQLHLSEAQPTEGLPALPAARSLSSKPGACGAPPAQEQGRECLVGIKQDRP